MSATAYAIAAEPTTLSRRDLLITACLGESLAQFGLTSVAAITPALAGALALGGQEVSWLLTSYLLALAGSLLVAGRLGDLLGHRRVFAVGAALYAGAVLGAASATSFEVLVGARILQGLGAAMVSGNSLAIVTRGFSDVERPRAIAILVAAGLVAGLSGAMIGGVTATYFGWQWLFVLIAPVALSTAARGTRLSTTRSAGVRVDWVGAALLVAAITTVAVVINHPHTSQYEPIMPVFHALLPTVAALFAAAFVIHERGIKTPLLGWGQLRDGVFARAVGANFALHVTMMSIFFLGPVIAVRALGLDTMAGIAVTIAGQGGMMIAALTAAAFSARYRATWIRPAGGLVIAIGLVAWAGASLLGSYVLVVLAAFVAGLGAGTMLATNNNLIMGLLPTNAKGVASGMIETTRQFGHAFGVTIPSAILALVGTGAMQLGAAASCVAMAGVMLLGVGLAVLSNPNSKRVPERADP